MGAGVSIAFLVDEQLPIDQVRPMLEQRGYLVTRAMRGSSDPSIMARAERIGSVVVTADTWFLDELLRYPPGHRRCFTRAGVVKVPGEWAMARRRIADYLPIVEAVYELRRTQPDQRVAIDLSQRWIRIFEP